MDRVNIPEISAGRFLQVVIKGEHYVFGASRETHYADLLKNALDGRGIEYKTKGDMGNVPFPRGNDYHAYGAGEFQRLKSGDILVWRPSKNNGVGYNMERLDELSEELEGRFVTESDIMQKEDKKIRTRDNRREWGWMI